MQKNSTYWYLHVGRASDLEGRDRLIYRLFEMLPGFLSVGTLALFVVLSFSRPDLAAYLTIIFSMYWLFRTIYLSIHLRYNFKRMRHNMALDWNARLADLKYEDVVHLVIYPFYNEAYEVVAESVRGLIRASWDPKTICVVLSVEERGGIRQKEIALRVKEEFGKEFLDFQVAVHPADTPGEIVGKGSNISFAAEEARVRILDPRKLSYDRVLVSALDIDTIVYPQYFACLTWYFLTAENPSRSSFQPVPLYNNNIWSAPMLSRVMAYSSSFWQMIQQERPEKLATFSSHAVPFQQLYEAGYWQKNVVSEDSRIFWNLLARYDGNYEVISMAYPVSMDANVAPTFFGTAKNIYKQHRRWTYGAENIAYILFTFMKNPRIPFKKKFRAGFVQIEGFWSLVAHPLVLFAVGWLPLLVGGRGFNTTVLSYNLPLVAKVFLTASLFGLVVCAAIGMQLVPERPSEYGKWRSLQLILQWALVPATMVIFTSIPGLDAQIRLFFGRYLGFWVTPKITRTT
ncbi:MAG: glycosyltransferase family 2 protein, partial [Candidatus Kaiserbacteria bacterium]|nr:glycosyltransferase family 2 protein [Candidatus Kaiserbacteria bacterium]